MPFTELERDEDQWIERGGHHESPGDDEPASTHDPPRLPNHVINPQVRASSPGPTKTSTRQ
jgi:hypothetical protein